MVDVEGRVEWGCVVLLGKSGRKNFLRIVLTYFLIVENEEEVHQFEELRQGLHHILLVEVIPIQQPPSITLCVSFELLRSGARIHPCKNVS